MSSYEEALKRLEGDPQTWLVTGVAGFIGSHLAETLLKYGQRVVALDSFVTGRRENLDDIRRSVGDQAWKRFKFFEGDICSLELCRQACEGVERVLHQAALGSIVRSVEDPIATHDANVTGFLNMQVAAREAGVKRFVYASSSAAYGDSPGLPKVEDRIGNALSPYGLSKRMDELYADVFARCYGFGSIGLRYFNVFGPRQDPHSAYAAVIPAFIAGLLEGKPVYINGDGLTSRDFCYIDNVVQANLLCALTENAEAINTPFNVAVGEQTSLNDLYARIQQILASRFPRVLGAKPIHRDFRPGDVKFSQADIGKARRLLGYEPRYRVAEGLEKTVAWYVASTPNLVQTAATV